MADATQAELEESFFFFLRCETHRSFIAREDSWMGAKHIIRNPQISRLVLHEIPHTPRISLSSSLG